MTLTFKQLHPSFVAEVSPVDLRTADSAALEEIRRGMDQYGVLVFRNQEFSDDEQLAFAERFDGTLHSNVGKDGQLLAPDDRRRMSSLANRLWHTDASFVDPAGRYSMLSARVIPPVHADTEYADMRGAYDALDEETKATIKDLRVHHSIAYSREVLGFEFAPGEKELLKGAVHPLVRKFATTGRRSLYLASHAQQIVGWPVPEARLLLRDLTEHATQPRFVHSHEWRLWDFVIWDNRTTMHRATPFDDKKYRRELRRTTTLDIDRVAQPA